MKKFCVLLVLIIAFMVSFACTCEREQPTGYDVYVVANGETVDSIARFLTPDTIDYRKTAYIIESINNIENCLIFPGQVLNVPVWE